mmetsp:Transcript_11720/g.47327  ORF Transcript_11720/g.47327 Transcript_11720/m.47327 type:complete len:201 (-) Transcript_11720:292-894(-)
MHREQLGELRVHCALLRCRNAKQEADAGGGVALLEVGEDIGQLEGVEVAVEAKAKQKASVLAGRLLGPVVGDPRARDLRLVLLRNRRRSSAAVASGVAAWRALPSSRSARGRAGDAEGGGDARVELGPPREVLRQRSAIGERCHLEHSLGVVYLSRQRYLRDGHRLRGEDGGGGQREHAPAHACRHTPLHEREELLLLQR